MLGPHRRTSVKLAIIDFLMFISSSSGAAPANSVLHTPQRLPGDGIGPEIVGATLDVPREADRISLGSVSPFETAAIGYHSLRSAGDDLSTKGFSGAFTGKLAPTAQGKC